MEMRGLKECLNEVLQIWKLEVKDFISDRHIQVRKHLREQYGSERLDKRNPHINHYLDIWHVAKSK